MVKRLQRLDYLLAISIIVLGNPICMIASAGAGGPKVLLGWDIKASKNTCYPGEPVLLTLMIGNTWQEEENIDFGADAIEAFSMEIRDNSNKIAAKGGKIQRFGVSRVGTLPVPPGQMTQKSIVLNQWCSTLLPPGRYRVICHVEYRLRSEDTKIPGTEHGFKAGPLHTIELGLDINIIEMNLSEFKKHLGQLSGQAFKTNVRTKEDFVNCRIAREMLVFAESELGVPYQLQLLKMPASTWLKRDATNSLVRSGTLEAANGLMEIIIEEVENKDCPECIEDVKLQIIDAVYRLRETGKSDIMNATNEFILKYKRPPVVKPENIAD